MARSIRRVGVRVGVLAALAMVGMTVACASGGAGTAATVATADTAPQGGRYDRRNLITRDAEACRKFYGELLG